MKVRLAVEVGALDRYLVARHFRVADGDAAPKGSRATRVQVRRFVVAALRTALRDQAASARGRARGVVKRLGGTAPAAAPGEELLAPPTGRQPTLW